MTQLNGPSEFNRAGRGQMTDGRKGRGVMVSWGRPLMGDPIRQSVRDHYKPTSPITERIGVWRLVPYAPYGISLSDRDVTDVASVAVRCIFRGVSGFTGSVKRITGPNSVVANLRTRTRCF